MNLGELISKLKNTDRNKLVRIENRCGSIVLGYSSYRGDYRSLAFYHTLKPHEVTVGEFLDYIHEEITMDEGTIATGLEMADMEMDEEFFEGLLGVMYGWKGGVYGIYESTELYISASGYASGIKVIGLKEYPDNIYFIIDTGDINVLELSYLFE